MLRKSTISYVLIGVLFTSVLFAGSVVAQDGSDGIDTEFSENESIDTVYSESNQIRIGDVEWTDDGHLLMTIENQGGLTLVSISDQASVLGSGEFQTIPSQSVRLSGDEVVTVKMDVTTHSEYGAIVTVSDGTQAVTLTHDGPTDGNELFPPIGVYTWLAGAGIAFGVTLVAGYRHKKNKANTPEQVF